MDSTQQALHEEILQEERRRNDSLVLGIVQDMHRQLSEISKTLNTHIAEEPKAFAAMVESAMAQAFPGGDPVGHRKVHEADIQRVLDRAEFWRKMLYELTKFGIIGFIGWAAWHLWVAFIQGPTK